MADSQTWSGFYKKGVAERQKILQEQYPTLFANETGSGNEFPIKGLDVSIADNMVENCVGTLGLPIGLGLNLVMNGKLFVVPMATEEPSVIAAVSNASKTITGSEGGGFIATHSERSILAGQIQILDIKDLDLAEKKINDSKAQIIEIGNEFCPRMCERGGGVVDILVRRIIPRSQRNPSSTTTSADRQSYLVVHVEVDVCEAMGANIVNTVCEGLAPFLTELTEGRIGLKILSNLSVKRTAKATFSIPVEKLSYKNFTGEEVANRILEAYQFAEDDEFRATTSNKGVMNGIDAVAVATGQDWRAVEAAAHSYVVYKKGYYGSLTNYRIETKQSTKYLYGELEIPVPVGTKGGSLMTNPVYQYCLGLMNNPDSKTLAMVICCIGLGQNFAALRALATEGIQKGHMSLHARNIAIAANVPKHLISQITSEMIKNQKVNVDYAKELLTQKL